MRKYIILVPLLLLAMAADAKPPKGCACNGLSYVATPAFSPAPNTYTTTQNVIVTSSTAGATLYCTTDNSQPTTSSPLCTNPEVISTTTTLKAIGTKPGLNQSVTQIGLFTIETQTKAPAFTPVSGPYSDVLFSFSMNSGTVGATCYYTTDSSTPTIPATGTTTLYTGPVTSLTSPGTYTPKGICSAAGHTNSNVTIVSYTLSGGSPTACGPPITIGTLNLTAVATRKTGASPLSIWFDATGTTDSGIINPTGTPFTDVTYTWDFGDTGSVSGAGSTWNYGSNRGVNLRNKATGGVAEHTYIILDGGGDLNTNVTLTATDGTNTASCTIPVTVYDPLDAAPNGFAGAKTTCVSSSGTPAPGVAGCPIGANVVKSATLGSVLPTAMSGLRYLAKCGDTFTASPKTLHGNTFRIGAYGSCAATQTGLPIYQLSQSGYGITVGSGPVQTTDGAISDIDFEGTGTLNTSTSSGYALFFGQDTPGHTYPMQMTIWNILSNNNDKTWQDYQGSQNALVQVVMNTMGGNQGIYFNNSGNQCTNGAHSYNCGGGAGQPVFDNINYNAMQGSYTNGIGAVALGGGPETVRVSACRLCVFTNNTSLNATESTAVFKFHDDSNSTANGPWYGQYAELSIISDGYYAAPNSIPGHPAAQLVEVTPENNVTDERNRNLVIERNIFVSYSSAVKGLALSVCTNARVSDNIFIGGGGGGTGGTGLAVQKRGIECNSTSGAPVNNLSPELVEAYNNTCYNTNNCMLSTAWTPSGGPGNDNWFINTLAYNASGGNVVNAGGTGNTISNNTGTITNNPGFLNGDGNFDNIPDFQPTANYSGALNGVPVTYDGNLTPANPFGSPWSPTWTLGAVNPLDTNSLVQAVKYSGCTFTGLLADKDAGDEVTGNTQAGTRLTLFTQYIGLINHSHCHFLGRTVNTFLYAPVLADLDSNLAAYNAAISVPHILGAYLAEQPPASGNYACTVAFCNGRNFIWANMIPPGETKASFNQPEFLAYMTQITQNLIDRGFQGYFIGEVNHTDKNGTNGDTLCMFMSNMRTYALTTQGFGLVFIAQQPSNTGGQAYFNNFDLIKGGVYINDDGTVPTTTPACNKGGCGPGGNPVDLLWLERNGNGTLVYQPQQLVMDYDQFGDPIDDSSEFACLDLPNPSGQAFLTYLKGLSSSNCPFSGTISAYTAVAPLRGVSVTQNIVNFFTPQKIGFWFPGRQKIAFNPGEYTPLNYPAGLNSGGAQQINWDDEAVLQIGTP